MKRAAINRAYVPKFNGNRDLEESEQVTVEGGKATLKEKDIYSAMKYGKKGSVEVVKKEYTALRKKIKKINNYVDDNGTPIDTPDKLISDMESGASESIELAEELWNWIMGYSVKDDEDEEESTEDLTEGEG